MGDLALGKLLPLHCLENYNFFVLKFMLSEHAGCEASESLDSVFTNFQRSKMETILREGRGGGRQPSGKEKGKVQKGRGLCLVTSS